MRNATIVILIIMLVTTGAFAKTARGRYLIATIDTPQKTGQRSTPWYKPAFKAKDGTVSAGFFAGRTSKKDSLRINGVNFEINMLSIALTPFVLVYLPEVKKNYESDTTDDNRNRQNSSALAPGETIKGVNISTGITWGDTKVRGLAINGTFGGQDEIKGVEINGLFCMHYVCDGVAIAPFNIIKKVRGIQIGIVNKCWDGRVVQIGLVNTIGKRTTPFINFKFKRRKHKAKI